MTEALRRLAVIGILSILPIAYSSDLRAQQSVDVRANEIGGVVTSSKGPEAGVWVIAETTDLPTKFARIVVTDDQGRYVIPDLPTANYDVWVRGYGLVDSPKMRAKPGKTLNHAAVHGAERCRSRALLSGDLLVRDDENSAGNGFRRLDRHSRRTSRRITGCGR